MKITDTIQILDFGSQYTQLIARRIRELNIYCEIIAYNKATKPKPQVKGIILSGSPSSVYDNNFKISNDFLKTFENLPLLGICFGAQYLVQNFGGLVIKGEKREYGRSFLNILEKKDPVFQSISDNCVVWMSHGDSIIKLPVGCEPLAYTKYDIVSAFKFDRKPWYGLQFHPEVVHTPEGQKVFKNFAVQICGCKQDWSAQSFIKQTVQNLKKQIGQDKVIMALSGGVDSSVAACLIQRAIGNNLHCICVDNGLLRKNEFQNIIESYKGLNLNIKGIESKEKFYKALEKTSDPEIKRKKIGETFIKVFEKEAKSIDFETHIKWLGQGTIYPDVIESISVYGPSQVIKSHHNVGGLPEKMDLKLIEPLRFLFKDEVRRVGKSLDLPDKILNNHPFPGPGLGIRILGEVNFEKVTILQEVDAIFIKALKEVGLYAKIWQAGAILLPVKTVGVMGDERSYEYAVALRAVTSLDGMTADWFDFPTPFLRQVSNTIINQVKEVNRVVYDISSKPPATIEWA